MTLLLALLATVQTPGPAEDLGLELLDVVAIEVRLSEDQATRIAERVARPADFLNGLEAFRARGAGPLGGDPEALEVLRLTLPAPLPGARLVCAVRANGRLAHATLCGLPESEDDLGWSLFLGQLCDYGALGPEDELVQDPSGPAATADFLAWSQDQRDGPDGRLFEALIGQRAAMRRLTLLQRRLILGQGALEAPWIRMWEAELDGLARRADALEVIVGSAGLADYRRELDGLRTRLGALGTLDPGEIPARARRLCGQCHTHPVSAAAGSGDWTEALANLRAELGFPRGVLRVNYDVAAVPGDDGTRSQLVADGVRALLLAAGEL